MSLLLLVCLSILILDKVCPHGPFKKGSALKNPTSSGMTLETQFSRFAVRTVYIREVGGSSPSAPTFSKVLFSFHHLTFEKMVCVVLGLLPNSFELSGPALILQ